VSTDPLARLLPSFELHLRASAKSPKTVTIYRDAVNRFVAWLSHTHPEVTDWSDVNTKAKQAALRATEPPSTSEGPPTTPVWRTDETLLNWLASL